MRCALCWTTMYPPRTRCVSVPPLSGVYARQSMDTTPHGTGPDLIVHNPLANLFDA